MTSYASFWYLNVYVVELLKVQPFDIPSWMETLLVLSRSTLVVPCVLDGKAVG